jgi:hypothetical protein
MKKILLSLLAVCTLTPVYCQKPIDISASISPAFPVGDLSDYVGGGFGLFANLQTVLKKNKVIGGEISFHRLSDGYNDNTFITLSAYGLYYFNSNYSLGRMPLKPYGGLGIGIYQSRYSDYFYGDDPRKTGLVFSPRLGIRVDADKVFLTGEARLHLSTGYADSYVPLVITIGYRLVGN